MTLQVFSHGRTASTRCPNKLMRPFGQGSSLLDILLTKLQNLREIGYPVFFASAESAIATKCGQYGIDHVWRTGPSAANSEDTGIIFDYLEALEGDWFLFINPCLPFLSTESIAAFIGEALSFQCRPAVKVDRPAFGIRRHGNYYLTPESVWGTSDVPSRIGVDLEDGWAAINWTDNLSHLDTRSVDPVYSFAHALYLFRKSDLLERGFFWDWNEVKLIPLQNPNELWDIDTEEDFKAASDRYYGSLARPRLD